MTMVRVLGMIMCAVLLTSLADAADAASDKYAANSPYGIPARLQRSLDERLSAFVDAQANERWDEVASLLGRYRKGGHGFQYSPEHKTCLLAQMKAAGMVSFTHEGIRFSSELRTTPPEKRWWYLDGSARFRDPSGSASRRVTIFAYRDEGAWYFSPPNYDLEWEATHVTDADRQADYRAEVQLDLDPACPLEIRDLHVRMDKKYPSLRNVSFALMNRTSKKVTGYGLSLGQVGEEGFGVTSGQPAAIGPGEVSGTAERLGYSAYVYWCDGISPQRLVIDSVLFADDSEWNDPRFLSDVQGRPSRD